jgi:hypothetical protein
MVHGGCAGWLSESGIAIPNPISSGFGRAVRQAQKVAPAIRMISKKLSQEATASAMRKTQMPSASERPAQAHALPAVPTTVTARRKSRAFRAKRKAFLS